MGRLISLRYKICLEQSLGFNILPPPLLPFIQIWYNLLITYVDLVWELQCIVVNDILILFYSFLNAYLITRDLPHPSDPTTKNGDPYSTQGYKIDKVF